MEGSGGRLISAARGCLEPFLTLGTLVAVLALGGLVFLGVGVSKGDPIALVILGGVVVLGVGLIFVGLTIGIIAFANWSQARREIMEQARFRDNTKENLALMQATAKTQSVQNSMLLRQAREAQRQLPAPAEDTPSIIFDEGIFDELEMNDDH
jgi:Na+-transporting methylmalonyl-CoA/oxaloacetate decarboxylase gamma subunit